MSPLLALFFATTASRAAFAEDVVPTEAPAPTDAAAGAPAGAPAASAETASEDVSPSEDGTPSEVSAAAAPAGASLAGGGTSGTTDLRVRYYRSADKLVGFEDRDILDYVEAVDRLDITGGNSRLTISLSGAAVALFGNRYILDGELYHERPLYTDIGGPFDDALFQLEKVSVVTRAQRGALTFGDSYASFGRGIAVNLNKNTDIDIDTSMRGVSGVLHVGSMDATAFTGVTNPQQIALENPNVALHLGRQHAVSGVRADFFGVGPLNVGAHGVVYQFAREVDPTQNLLLAYDRPVDALVGGATVEALGLGGIDWFVEGDVFDYAAEDLAAKSGYEVYLSASAYPGWGDGPSSGMSTLQFEAKRQKNTEVINAFAGADNYEFASGPTLEYERVITEDSAAAVNSNDLTGGRIRWDIMLGKGGDTLTPYISEAVFYDAEVGGLHFNVTPEVISHTVAGLTWVHGEAHLLLNGGFRLDRRTPDGAADFGADRMMHVDASLTLPIAGEVSVELAPAAQQFHWGANAQQQSDYLDFSGTIAFKVGAPWALIFYTDYSSNPLVRSTGNLAEDVYGAVEAQWKPSTSVTLKAFYGAYRAGIRCAGGQCRSLPGFDGARLSATATF